MARNLNSLTISAPTSDPTQSEGGNFTFTVTPGFAGGGGVNAYDLDLQWDQGTATWQTIPGSGGLSTAGTAYYASTTQDTAFTITVDCNTAGDYNIRALNTSRSITSTPTSQAVTVTSSNANADAPTAVIAGAAAAPDNVIGDVNYEVTGAASAGTAAAPTVEVHAPTDITGAASAGQAQAPASVTTDAIYTITGAAISSDAGTSTSEVDNPRPSVGPFAYGSHGVAVNSYGTFTKGGGAVSDQGEPTGAQAAAQAGAPANVTGDANYTLTGAAAAGEAAAPSSITGDANYTLTGAGSAGEAGTSDVTGDSNYTLTGAASTGGAGTVTVDLGVSIDATGAAIAGQAAAPTVTGDVNYTLTGASAAAGAGTSTAQVDTSIDSTGAAIAGQAGTSTSEVSTDENITGAQIAATAAASTVIGDVNHTVTGAAIAGAAGTSEGVTPDVSVDLTGAQSAAAAGTVTAQADVNHTLTGAASNAQAGTSAVTVDISVSLTGAESPAAAGTVTGDGGVAKGTFTTPKLSPLGLGIRQYGTFDHIGLLRNGLGDITPLGLHQRAYGSFEAKLQAAVITGAAVTTQAGTVDVFTTDASKAELGPHGLVTPTRNFSKQSNQHVNASITGAAIQAQWSHPDLADATIYSDAVEIAAGSGSVASDIAYTETAAISADAGTVTISVDIDASITGAGITGETGEITAIGGTGGVDVAVTPNPPVQITGESGTVTAAHDWIQSVTGAQISALHAEVGIDSRNPVSVTITGAEIGADAAAPALAGPHVTVNLESAKITLHAGEPEQAPRQKGRTRRKHYVIEIDGQPIIVNSVAEAQALLAQVEELAEAAAERDITIDSTPPTPVIQVKTGSGKASQSKVIQEATLKTQRTVNAVYEEVAKRRRIDAEISKLLIAKIESEDEEEEAIIALLLA